LVLIKGKLLVDLLNVLDGKKRECCWWVFTTHAHTYHTHTQRERERELPEPYHDVFRQKWLVNIKCFPWSSTERIKNHVFLDLTLSHYYYWILLTTVANSDTDHTSAIITSCILVTYFWIHNSLDCYYHTMMRSLFLSKWTCPDCSKK
jgi:hypothetical protein